MSVAWPTAAPTRSRHATHCGYYTGNCPVRDVNKVATMPAISGCANESTGTCAYPGTEQGATGSGAGAVCDFDLLGLFSAEFVVSAILCPGI